MIIDYRNFISELNFFKGVSRKFEGRGLKKFPGGYAPWPPFLLFATLKFSAASAPGPMPHISKHLMQNV